MQSIATKNTYHPTPFFFFLISNLLQGEGEERIQNSDLRFMKRGPQPIRLPLEALSSNLKHLHWIHHILAFFSYSTTNLVIQVASTHILHLKRLCWKFLPLHLFIFHFPITYFLQQAHQGAAKVELRISCRLEHPGFYSTVGVLLVYLIHDSGGWGWVSEVTLQGWVWRALPWWGSMSLKKKKLYSTMFELPCALEISPLICQTFLFDKFHHNFISSIAYMYVKI